MTKDKIIKTFSNMPELETDRLLLRKIKPSDADDMYEYSCREDVTRYLLWKPHPNRNFTERYINELQGKYRSGEFYDWAVELKSNKKMIGTCGFTSFDTDNNCSEIGYVLNPNYWNCGYTTEAAMSVITFGFCELNQNRIEARYMIGNDQSRRVMEKCGLKCEGVNRGLMYVRGSYRDICTYAMLYEDFTLKNIIHDKPVYKIREKNINCKIMDFFMRNYK